MNQQVILVARPAGVAQSEHFAIRTSEPAPLGRGQLRIRNRFLSVEPAMRGWIADRGNYSAPVGIGEVMRAIAVGEVVESDCADYSRGAFVTGWFSWQEEAVVDPSAVIRRVIETDLPLSLSLGVLGINGVAAHLGLTLVGQPRAGETVMVSTAAGSVGSAVGQIARKLGCRAVGIAGGPGKVAMCLEQFGYDAAIDYRAAGLGEALTAACPDGINVYFDNVAGRISDTVYPQLAQRGRVVVCGTASIPTWDPWPQGPRIERHLLVKRARAEGFVVFDHFDRWDDSVATLAGWVRDGSIVAIQEILDGIESCPDALAGLYRGENAGKRIIRLA